MSQRVRVIALYKQLQYLGKDYPGGPEKFRSKCHNAFQKNSQETDPAKIEKMLAHGDFIIKELETLYALKKYRTMKKRYYSVDEEFDKLLEKYK